ncbi:MAG: BMP family protein [Spirochaetaceae bacterium]
MVSHMFSGRARIALAILVAIMLLVPAAGLFASGSAEEGEESGGSAAVVFGRGGLGDESFNDAAFRGLQRAGEELGISFDYAEPQAVAEFEPLLTQFAAQGGYDLIISIGFEQGEALGAVAQEFPEQQFAIIDTVVDQPNVASYVYEEQERGFMMGAVAALTTLDADDPMTNDLPRISVIGGVQSPLIDANIAGFYAGAEFIDSEIEVSHAYVGSWADPARGKEIAISMIENGSDVVWGAAGRSGLGVLDAAMEQGVYGIGSDSDQSSVAPDHVLTNGMKLVDETVFIAIQQTVNGEFQGGLNRLGVAEGALGYTDSLLAEETLERMEEVTAAIVNNEVDIPTTLD